MGTGGERHGHVFHPHMSFLQWVRCIDRYTSLIYCWPAWQAWQRGHRDGFRPHVSPELCHNFVQPWRAHRGQVAWYLYCWCGSVGHEANKIWVSQICPNISCDMFEFAANLFSPQPEYLGNWGFLFAHHSREFHGFQTVWFSQVAPKPRHPRPGQAAVCAFQRFVPAAGWRAKELRPRGPKLLAEWCWMIWLWVWDWPNLCIQAVRSNSDWLWFWFFTKSYRVLLVKFQGWTVSSAKKAWEGEWAETAPSGSTERWRKIVSGHPTEIGWYCTVRNCKAHLHWSLCMCVCVCMFLCAVVFVVTFAFPFNVLGRCNWVSHFQGLKRKEEACAELRKCETLCRYGVSPQCQVTEQSSPMQWRPISADLSCALFLFYRCHIAW